VHAGQLVVRGARGLVVRQEVVELADVQEFLDGIEAGGLLRMAVAHLVQAARRVRDECHGHGAIDLR
jgi:hypothetical protein